MKRRTRTTTRKSNRKAPSGRLTWKFYSFAVICVVALLGSLFLAGRNHFASVKYGFSNAQLRQELDQLQAEKRRLMISKEVATSPAEIDRAARKLGLVPMTARNIQGINAPAVPGKDAQTPAQKQAPAMLASANSPSSVKKVGKTALVTPSTESSRARN